MTALFPLPWQPYGSISLSPDTLGLLFLPHAADEKEAYILVLEKSALHPICGNNNIKDKCCKPQDPRVLGHEGVLTARKDETGASF